MTEKNVMIGDGLTDEDLLAQYVEKERYTEMHGECWADGFVRVQFKKAVLSRMSGGAGAEKPTVQP